MHRESTLDQEAPAPPVLARPRRRILEIGFQPLLKSAFPEQTEYVDTRFRWADARTYEVKKGGVLHRLGSMARQFVGALFVCARTTTWS